MIKKIVVLKDSGIEIFKIYLKKNIMNNIFKTMNN